ncbi:MAG: MFS transporter [Candidatus Bathyarchaeia archaeon]
MRLLSRLERGNIVSLIAIAGFRGLRDNLRQVVWQPYVLSLGFSMQRLGNLESLMDLTRILFQPAVGAASDTYGRKRFLVIRELLILLALMSLVFAQSWHLLAVSMVLVGLNWAFFPVWNSLIAESTEPERMGFSFSLIGSAYTGLGLVGTLSAGYLAESYGFSIVYVISSVFGLLSLIMTYATLDESLERGDRDDFTMGRAVKSLIASLKPPERVRGFYIAMGVDLFAFSLGYRILNGMLTESYGYTPYMLGLMSAVMIGSMSLSQIFVGRYVDKVGYSRYLATSQILSCVFLGITLYTKHFHFILLGMILMGVASALWGPAEQAWIARNVDSRERAQSLGSYATFRALVSFPAPSIGGLLYEVYGFDIPVGLNMALALINAIMILKMVD